MFQAILICTDGSRLAGKGVRAGVRLAAALGARVSGVYVLLPTPAAYNEAAISYAGRSAREWRRSFEAAARRALGGIEAAAQAAGVRCETRVVRERRPWKGILRAARARKCDAIVIASQGRGALGGLLLGSETQQVLARSRIPVLVVR
jgi:nucleotide-binding universal stress UspA family protein